MDVGVVTLGDHLPDPISGVKKSEAERFRSFVELAELSESLGFHAIYVGEHHFSDYALSSPPTVLAAIAERTHTVRLSTAATLLPHRDVVTVAEDYASVDVLSGGRVEMIAGRGVYAKHYAQFGQDAAQSDAMLIESVNLLRKLWTEEHVTWEGRYRPPLTDVTVRPRPLQQPHPPVWLSASSPESVDRAVELGCPIMIPTISTGVDRAAELGARYRNRWMSHGPANGVMGLGLHVHLYVDDGSDADVREHWLPYQLGYLSWVLQELQGPGASLPPTLADLGDPKSQAVCGGVDFVTSELQRRLAAMGGVDRLLVQCDQGGLPFSDVEKCLKQVAQLSRDLG